MCGIAGLARKTSRIPAVDRSRAADVLRSLHHRGPDAEGEYSDDRIWLGHSRLSIIDLSAAGDQPMTDEDLVLVYNGEVYNFKDLTGELSLCGFRSRSDTEVILKAFRKLGVGTFAKLNGMFA